jgi:hypothetical protein
VTREEWVEKEVAEQEEKMPLDAHNKTTLRSMKGREFDQLEREAVREDNHTGRDDQ